MATKKTQPATPATTIIEQVYFNGSQSAEMRLVYQYNGHKFKIAIDRDSYDKQSSAIGYIWHAGNLSWNLVCSIHYTMMASLKAHVYTKAEIQKQDFEADITELKRKINSIVF